jgi:aldehyde:ferredoxin oxidoreductase
VTATGVHGRIVRVDLGTGRIRSERLDEATWRTWVGGSLLATRLLMTETPPGLDAFAPAAMLVFASSAVAGHRAPGLARFSVAAKSPLTGGIGEARAEGPFGVALKAAGVDAVVITGRAERPVSLVIHAGELAIVDAGDLLGLDTSEVVDVLVERVGPCHVAAIGPAGEALVRYASIVSDRSFAAPRMGLGAVMGSKHLKAVAILDDPGLVAPAIVDPEALGELGVSYAARLPINPVTAWQREPPGFGAWVGAAGAGTFAVENYRTSAFDPSGYAAPIFLDRLAWSEAGCPGCPTDCIKGFAPSKDETAVEAARSARTGGLHQEAIAALGPNLGLADAADAIRLNDRCLRLGLDPVSMGLTLSFAMESRDVGLLTSRELHGSRLAFGHSTTVFDAVEQVARREGIGDWLADGVRRAADRLPAAAGRFALHVKGLEMTTFDPRAQTGLALGFATAPFGPRYDVAEHDLDYDDEAPSWPHALELSRPLGIDRLQPSTATTPEKVRSYAILSEFWSALDALLVCPFASAPVRILSLDEVAGIVRAVTGWDTDPAEVLGWGARRIQLMRVYNLREGIGADQDTLPDRFFDAPIDTGRFAGQAIDRRAFRAMVGNYYERMGWDASGVPTAATLARHGLEWAAAS